VPLPIGFDFPFYGRLYRSVNTCSNGYLSFTDMSQHPSNISFPAPAAAPLAAIAPFWDDLTVYYTNWYWAGDQDRLIVEYRHLRDSNGGSDLTFQVVLYRTGKILFNYLTMAGQVDSATIGIQNEDGTIGLTVAQDIPFAHYGLTIEFSYAPEWLKVEPAMGVSMPGESAEVEAGLDASALPEGDHHAFIRLVSNDPLKRRVDIPILLHVGEVALDYVHIAPNTVNLSSKGKAIRSTLQLPVQYDPHDVAVETVSINGTLFADPTKVSFADQNGDGIEEIVLRFNRRAFQAMMPVGKSVPVTITGEVRDTIWFRGSDTIRTIHPRPISMEEP
jgi:hypothetical protein